MKNIMASMAAEMAKYSKPGMTRAVDIRLRGRKTARTCYCLKTRIQNNRLGMVKLNAFGSQEIKDADGEGLPLRSVWLLLSSLVPCRWRTYERPV